ncbi:unnamed protein product [Ilex paraguariensis]|uniref:Phytocyanin domain-containing protein n=1 Tax=Ilex paraguariensis TaxID=185542 RepID=A0ABC8UJ47_9AQUA
MTSVFFGDGCSYIAEETFFFHQRLNIFFFCRADFDFEFEFHNVMQVSRREYDSCTANQPFKAFTDGPAIVNLIEEGISYFICSVSNYCYLGQKFSVIVHENTPSSAPNSSPLPSSVPISQSKPPRDQRGVVVSTPTSNSYDSLAPDSLDWPVSLMHMSSAGVGCNGVLFGWASALCLVALVVFARLL